MCCLRLFLFSCNRKLIVATTDFLKYYIMWILTKQPDRNEDNKYNRLDHLVIYCYVLEFDLARIPNTNK